MASTTQSVPAASETDALAAKVSALKVTLAEDAPAAPACETGRHGEATAAATDAAAAAPVDGTTIDTEFVPGKIFVGGLAWCTTSTSLREHFSTCVNILLRSE